MKKNSTTEKIIAYKKANPKATYSEMAKEFKCNISLIGFALKGAGMTKPRNKTKKPTKGQEVLRQHILKDNEYRDGEIHRLNVEVYTLTQRIIGYVSVISYLESKLGIEDGAPV